MKKLIKENVFKIEQYEPGKPVELLRRELGIEGEVCKLASNENPLGPSPLALEAITRTLEEGNFYPDNSCYALREKIGKRMGFPIRNIRIGNGSSELIYMAGMAILNPEDNIVMSEFAFVMGKLIAQIVGCRSVAVPLVDYRHDLDGLLAAIDENTKIVYIDMPMNPIGTSLTRAQFDRFMDEVPEDVLVICDEAYYEYADKDDYPHTLRLVKEGRNVLVLRTFSKLYGLAGFRVGYGFGREDIIDALRLVSLPFAVNKFAQIGAVAALDDKDHVEKTLEVTKAGKKYLYEKFDEMSVVYIPSETNFITVDVKTDAVDVCAALQKRGIIVRPLSMYDKPSYLRVSIGTMKQNEKFIDAFKAIYV
ncbi:MAG: histidinol-phosphate transaminase [Candidatus Aminicenantes bacterium]|nr:histidinol-phosphate transaminase [Candidatus Aminicenantes bacterium]